MLLPRVEGISRSEVEGPEPVGLFSGWITDGNVVLMSLLLIASAALLTLLWPARAPRPAVIVGLAPAAWSLIVIDWRADEGFWPLIVAFVLGYGGVMAVAGVVLAKSAVWLSRAGKRS